MLWVSLAVSVLVGLAVREFFIGYVRRNRHDGYWPLKGAGMPAITIGPGLGVLLVNPRNGTLLLALSIPVVAVISSGTANSGDQVTVQARPSHRH